MIKAALLDLDGVIVDSEPLYFQVVSQLLNRYGVEIGPNEYVRRWMIEDTGVRNVIRDYDLARMLGVDPEELLHEIRERKADMVQNCMDWMLEMMPGAEGMIEFLHAAYPLGLVTSADKSEAEMKLGKFDLLGKFKFFVTANDVSSGKSSSSEPYQKAVAMTGFEPYEVVAIEDNPKGVRSAKGAGCRVIAYPNGFTAGMDFDSADIIIRNLTEIGTELILSLSARIP